jgi:NADH-quinone oxidoreductase subunit L
MEHFWGDSITILPTHQAMEHAEHIPLLIKWLPLVLGLAGIALAWWMYVANVGVAAVWAVVLRPFYLLSFNKWYFDEIYNALFVRTAFVLGRGLWKSGDGAVIDGVGPDGIAAATVRIARRASVLQSGYLYHYAFAMLIGVVVLITLYFFQA